MSGAVMAPVTFQEAVERHRAALAAGRARRAASSRRTGRLRASRPGLTPTQGQVQAPALTPGDERLGTRETEFPPSLGSGAYLGALTCAFPRVGLDVDEVLEQAEEKRRGRQRARWADRRVVWDISGFGSMRACGRGVIDHDQGVAFKRRDGRVYTSGTTRCHSIWCCPVDAAAIRAERASDISEAIVRHLGAGGTAYLVTLTARHYRRHSLEELLDAIRDGFKGLTSGAQWAGDKARGREGERQRMGVVGIIRATEVTESERNGWHPHLHLVVLMGAVQRPRPAIPRQENRPEGWVKPEWDPTPTGYFPVPDPSWDRSQMTPEVRQHAEDFDRMRERWDRTWAAWLEKSGFRPNREHGVKWDRIHTARDAKAMGEYIAKIQEGKGDKARDVAVGHEVARLDMKAGAKMRGADTGSRTPFELLSAYRQLRALDAQTAVALGLDVDKRLARLRELWHEYEQATRGRRAIEWSRHLRDALGMGEEATDEQIIEADQAGVGFAAVDADTWRRICRLRLDYEIVMSAELGGFEGLQNALAELGLTAVRLADPDSTG
jgi:hypothetical protein